MKYYILKTTEYYRDKSPIMRLFRNVYDAVQRQSAPLTPTAREVLVNNWPRILTALKAGYPNIEDINLYNKGEGASGGFVKMNWTRPYFIEGEYQIVGHATGENNHLTIMCEFTLTRLINCCGIIVLTAVKLPDKNTESIREKIHDLCEDIGRNLGYTLIMLTNTSIAHKKFLDICGWKEICAFTNKRTGNIIYMETKKL